MTQVQKLVDENEEMRNVIHNLRLYITALRDTVVSPDKWKAFEKRYSGLGGFTEVYEDDED